MLQFIYNCKFTDLPDHDNNPGHVHKSERIKKPNQAKKWQTFLDIPHKSREVLRDETGSVSILIFSLFLILLIISIGIIDTTDAFIAKRELVGILEPGVQRAARSIDLQRYYEENELGEKVPVDCSVALRRAEIEVSQMQLRERNVVLTGATCENDELVVSARSSVVPIIDFPIFHGLANGAISITAEVGASSIYK